MKMVDLKMVPGTQIDISNWIFGVELRAGDDHFVYSGCWDGSEISEVFEADDNILVPDEKIAAAAHEAIENTLREDAPKAEFAIDGEPGDLHFSFPLGKEIFNNPKWSASLSELVDEFIEEIIEEDDMSTGMALSGKFRELADRIDAACGKSRESDQ